MNFQIIPLPADKFTHYKGLSDEDLTRNGVKRVYADEYPGFPCRISLEDAPVGEPLLLLNFDHQSEGIAYRSSHAIFVRENADEAKLLQNQIPEVLSRRLISVRGFNSDHDMVQADVVEGDVLEGKISEFFEQEEILYLHLHNAKQGCYAARVDRV